MPFRFRPLVFFVLPVPRSTRGCADRALAIRGRTRTALVVMLLVNAFAGASSVRAADTTFDAEVARKFAGVAAWQGFWETSEQRSISRSNNAGYTNNRFEGLGHGRFELSRDTNGWAPEHGEFQWRGNGIAAGMRNESMSKWSKYGPRMLGEDWQASDGGQVAMKDVEFTIWMNRRHASLHAGRNLDGALRRHRVGHAVTAGSGGDGQHHYIEQAIDETTPGAILTFFIPNYEKTKLKQWAVVQGGPGVLAFQHEERAHDSTAGDTVRRSRVVLVPDYEDVEVEVTIEGYADWRPLGSIADPTKPGSGLVARATLKSKQGKAKSLPEVEQFRFELLDTSREPGVCLNWPLAAKDEDYDLRFADLSSSSAGEQLAAVRSFFAAWGLSSSGDYDLASMPAGGVPRMSFGQVSENGQRAEVMQPPKDKTGQPFAEAAIECFDFGAKAELRVTCVLQDGRELLGLMKSENGEQDLVRLPKRAGPDWIAESWRKQNRATTLAADDDNEKVEGQLENGDGFTLYEEYRGWVVNGKHVEGDPQRKDFFVLNLIGADAKTGINLFEALSKLRVHSQLRRSEMSRAERLMNGNHRDAPHRVDQHGVWVKQFVNDPPGTKDARSGKEKLGDSGAHTPLTQSGVAGRPKIVIGIGLLARNNTESIFNQPFNLPARDTILAFDRALAHELMHSVGVEHHGAGDRILSAWWVSPRHPRNQVGRPYFRGMTRMTMSGQRASDEVITLLNEQGHDLATQHMSKYSADRVLTDSWAKDRLLAEGKAYMSEHAGQQGLAWNSAEEYAEYFLEENVSGGFAFLAENVGQPQGQHSGDQDCLMRYYFAKFYPARGKEDTYYLVTPGTERIGIDICHSRNGTGINAPNPPNLPQSRYGDAAGDAGNCFEQICPNDAIPPRPSRL